VNPSKDDRKTRVKGINFDHHEKRQTKRVMSVRRKESQDQRSLRSINNKKKRETNPRNTRIGKEDKKNSTHRD
jgi:hypothetical protein